MGIDWNLLISFAGTAMGTLGGIIVSQKLTSYRLAQLEKKVDKHNNLVERMYRVEGKIEAIEERLNH